MTGETWSIEAAEILNQLTKGIVLQAQVAGYNSHNIPEIYLFASLGPNVSMNHRSERDGMFVEREIAGDSA